MVKVRVGIWLVIIALGIPLGVAAFTGHWQEAVALGGFLAVISHKLIESEEKGRNE